MRDILKPGIVLLLVTLVAAVCLGSVYGITKEPIAQQQLLTRNNAMRELLPNAQEESGFEEGTNIPKGSGVTSYFTAKSGSDTVGYIIGVSPVGYAGNIDLLVALNKDGVIEGIKVTSHSETPGLGANARDAKFTNQFKGKSGQLSVTKSDSPKENEIEAITSATITTRAIAEDGVNNALKFFESNLKGGK